MERKLKVAKQEPSAPQAALQQAPPQGYFVPVQIMDEIIGYIGQDSWFDVNDFINRIRSSVQPVYPKNQVKNETENQTAPVN